MRHHDSQLHRQISDRDLNAAYFAILDLASDRNGLADQFLYRTSMDSALRLETENSAWYFTVAYRFRKRLGSLPPLRTSASACPALGPPPNASGAGSCLPASPAAMPRRPSSRRTGCANERSYVHSLTSNDCNTAARSFPEFSIASALRNFRTTCSRIVPPSALRCHQGRLAQCTSQSS